MLATAHKSILLLIASILVVESSSPLEITAAQRSSKLSAKEVERLRQMFRHSHKLGTESLDELSILRYLKQFSTVNSSAPSDENGLAELNSHKITVHRDGKNHRDNQYKISTPDKAANQPQNGKETVAKVPADLDIVVEESLASQSSNHHLDSNARQSSLFSGFKLPTNPTFGNGLGGSNPFLSALAKPPVLPSLPTLPTLPTLPALPTLPTFPVVTPKPPKPAKSSIISNNNGGPMALTNDNVVVVNVLSNNY